MPTHASSLLKLIKPSGKKKATIAFNFSASDVKIAFAQIRGGKPEITHCGSCVIEGLTETDAAAQIKAAITGWRIKDPSVVICVDSESIITKNIEIPSINDSEIREIIDLQAGRYTPYAREEILLDYVNIGTYHNSYTKVLIVILVQEIIKKQLAILAQVGLEVTKVLLASEAFGIASTKLLGASAKATPSVAVNCGIKSSDFVVICRGKTVFVRNIPIGREQLQQDAPESASRFVEEVKKSLESYRTEDIDAPPDETLLVGPSDTANGLRGPLVQGLNLPVKYMALDATAPVSSQVKVAIAGSPQVSFVNAIAAVVAFAETRIDLRPSELKMRIAFEERSREMIKSGAFFMAIIVTACSLLLTKVYYKGQLLNKLTARLAELEPQVATLDKASTRIQVVKNYLDYKRESLEVLSALYELVPDEIYLKGITVDEQGNLSIKGTADAMSLVFTFVTALENSKYFENASAKNTASRKEEGREVAEFEISCAVSHKK